MSGYQMLAEHLTDLYQYLKMYRSIYNDGLAEPMIESVKQRYFERTGKDIEQDGNPRHAGRKIQYNPEQIEEIKRIYDDCGSVRETARRSGVSTTTVYKAINT